MDEVVLQKSIFSLHTKAGNQWISTEKLHSKQEQQQQQQQTREKARCVRVCV